MILVTGGSGFIGSHTVRALHDLGERCVLVSRRTGEVPAHLADLPVVVERGDVTDAQSLRTIGDRHEITGIVHLAGSMPWPVTSEDPVAAARSALGGLFDLVALAQEWGVTRVGVASTIGVYAGAPGDGPLREDLPLPLASGHVIPTFKKIGELLGGHLTEVAGVDIVNYRISGTWGPLGHEDPFFAAPALIHAAARSTAPDLSGLAHAVHAEDALDLCYVKDTGRAVALLQLADRLNHRTYNVASGRTTSNAEIATAIRSVVPEARVDLPSGGDGAARHLDITRLHEDTGFTPEFDTARAAADYLSWLRSGNLR